MGFPLVRLILAFVLLSLGGRANAKIIHGQIDSKTDFVFLGSFFFSNQGENVLKYDLKYPLENCCHRLVSFDDSNSQWNTIRPTEDLLECKYKVGRVDNPDFNIKLSGKDDFCGKETDDDGHEWLRCQGQIDFSSQLQPRWWFIHLTHCQNGRGPVAIRNVTYILHFTNGELGMLREFPANQNLLLETDLGFLLGYLIMAVIATQYRLKLLKKNFLHLTYRLFYASLMSQTASIALFVLGLFQYARSGKEQTAIQDTAEMFSCLASITFVFALLLVSKGFSITRPRISRLGSAKVVAFGLIYAVAYTVSFVCRRVTLDPRDVIFVNWNMAASGIVGTKFVGVALLMYGAFFTVKHHPRKANFYLPFVLFFAVWFTAEPTYILLSYSICHIFRRFVPNVSNGIDLGLTFLGHVYFLYLTRPCWANKRFPFHRQPARKPKRPKKHRGYRAPLPDTNVSSEVVIEPNASSEVLVEPKAPDPPSVSITIPEDTNDHFETVVTAFHPDSDSDSDFGCDDDDDTPEIAQSPSPDDFQVVAPSSSGLTTVTTLVDRPKRTTTSHEVTHVAMLTPNDLPGQVSSSPSPSPPRRTSPLEPLTSLPGSMMVAQPQLEPIGVKGAPPLGGYSIFSTKKLPAIGQTITTSAEASPVSESKIKGVARQPDTNGPVAAWVADEPSGSRSGDVTSSPPCDSGDTRKKTKRQPSHRRFPPPGEGIEPLPTITEEKPTPKTITTSAEASPVSESKIKGVARQPDTNGPVAAWVADEPSGSRSGDVTSSPPCDSGDTRKKTKRQPSHRRFPPPGEGIEPLPTITEEKPTPKTKGIKARQKKLKKFLKKARRKQKSPALSSSLPHSDV